MILYCDLFRGIHLLSATQMMLRKDSGLPPASEKTIQPQHSTARGRIFRLTKCGKAAPQRSYRPKKAAPRVAE